MVCSKDDSFYIVIISPIQCSYENLSYVLFCNFLVLFENVSKCLKVISPGIRNQPLYVVLSNSDIKRKWVQLMVIKGATYIK